MTNPSESTTESNVAYPPTSKPFRWTLWLTLSSPILFIGGCSIFFFQASSKYLPSAKTASSHLHEQLARGEDAQVYANADPALRTALPNDTAFKFLARVRRKLGKCEYTGPNSWLANSNSDGTFVTLTYHDRCSNGEADETLVWRIVDGNASLVSMNVNSPLLLTD